MLPQRARRRRIFALALPIIGAMTSQNILNLIDTAMVGHLGNVALAAVGMGGFLNWLTTALWLGLGAGVQALAARHYGAGRYDRTAVPLNGGLLLVAILATPWSWVFFTNASELFPLISDDPAVIAAGAPYYRARLTALVAMAANVCFRGFWNATDRSRLYMRTLIAMHVLNLGLNYILIFGKLGAPELGVLGAGIGSAAATWFGTLVYAGLAWRRSRAEGFLRGRPAPGTVRTIARLAIPAGTQQLFFSGGMTAFYWVVGRVGTAELAATNVIINLLLVGILPGLGFGLAALSLVGQALGRHDIRDAARWGREVAILAVFVVGALAVPGWLAPDLLLRIFIHDADTLALARGPLRLVAALLALDAAGMVLMHALQGAGDNARVMRVSILLQWGIFLPVAYLIGPVGGYGLMAIWCCYVAYRGIQTSIFAVLWQRGRWADIRL